MYYDDGKIKVRDSVEEDIEFLSSRLKKTDVDEVFASNHVSPEEALRHGMDTSIYCRTAENGQPFMMFGLYTDNVISDRANIWMLSSDYIKSIPIKFVRQSRLFIKDMLEWYPYLENYVDARNKESIAWLKWLGATIEDPKPYGIEQRPFHHFYFKRSK